MHKKLYSTVILFFLVSTCNLTAMKLEEAMPNAMAELKAYTMLMEAYKNRPKNESLDSSSISYFAGSIKQHKTLACVAFIYSGSKVDTKLRGKCTTLLHVAAKAGYYPFCLFLLDAQIIDVNADTPDERSPIRSTLTPLHCAAKGGHPEICKLLLNRGAHALQQDEEGRLPLYYAIIKSSAEPACIKTIAKLLTQNKTDINTPLKDGTHIFDHAARKLGLNYFFSIFPLLMQLGAGPEVQDAQGQTPIHRFMIRKERDKFNIIAEREQALLNILIAYQAYLESKAVITILAIHKLHKKSLFAQIPKDVIRFVLIPFMRPFKAKYVKECVNHQLVLLAKLLRQEDNQCRIPKEVSSRKALGNNSFLLYTFDPQLVEQHREKLTQQTAALFDVLALKKSKNKVL